MKITIRLRPGKNDDIRKWYKSLERGERSRKIRKVLKDHIYHKGKKSCSFINRNQEIEFYEANSDIKKKNEKTIQGNISIML